MGRQSLQNSSGWVQFLHGMLKMEVVRMDEELVLKTSSCKRFGGSIPFASAKNGKVGEMD